LTVTVNIAANAPASVTNSVTIAGGGCLQINSAQNVTAIGSPPPFGNPIPYNGYIALVSGSTSGKVHSGIEILTALPIAVGDMMFMALFYNFTGNVATVVSMSDDGPAGSWAPMFPVINYIFSGTAFGFQVWYGRAGSAFAGSGTFHLSITFSDLAQNADVTQTFLCVSGISTLSQVVTGTAAAGGSQTGPPITTTQNSFVLSMIAAGENHFTIPAPFFIAVGLISYIAGFNPGTGWVAPAGTYAPTWTNLAGTSSAAIANASFL
jgi:hypothetical protein